MSLRSVSQILQSERTLEGGGFPVRRPFPTPRMALFDPFLLLDELGPVEWAPGEAIGAPPHPHRGFETITYLLAGENEHRDSHGHEGTLRPGDVQWMTAGRGVIHSEMPSRDFLATGGRAHGFQLWVNLPAERKMMTPRYQDIRAEDSPVVLSPDGETRVRIIAGEAFGERAEVQTVIPMVYLHVTLQPSAHCTLPVSSELNCFVYPFRDAVRVGQGSAASRDAGEGDAALLSNDGDEVALTAGHLGAEVLVIAGQPLREPVARYGPFVMNTNEQLAQAVSDYQSGRFGKDTPET